MSAPTRKKPAESAWQRHRVAGITAVVALVAAFGVYHVVTGDTTQRKRVLDTVALQLVPPPPPPPPKEEPPPPKMVEEQKIEPPVDKPDAPKDAPPPGPLALDAKGGPGSDSFGLGGKIGGSDFLDGGGGTRFGHFAVLMQDQISQSLRKDDKLDVRKFRATIKVWLSKVGKIDRVQMLHTTGDADTDSRIVQVIDGMPVLPETPPDDMPQPVIVRIGAASSVG
jgi:hypothetical protein